MTQCVSVIVPTLNEGAVVESFLQDLQVLRDAGCELILSDGGSHDDTCEKARPWVDQLVAGSSGRAAQMNRGAAIARGEWLWFLHVDTRVSSSPVELLRELQLIPRDWGFFPVRLDAEGLWFRIIETLMNWRSRVTGIGTGDQGLFLRRELFQRSRGFAQIPLMEDVEICRRLRRLSRPHLMRARLITSARRWQTQGVLRTVFLMWRLRLAFFLGVSPQRLAEQYRPCSSPTRES